MHTVEFDNADWIADFSREMEVYGASGREIGAAVTEVTQHCADERTSAEREFGPAHEYARALTARRTRVWRVVLRRYVPVALALLALLWASFLPLHDLVQSFTADVGDVAPILAALLLGLAMVSLQLVLRRHQLAAFAATLVLLLLWDHFKWPLLFSDTPVFTAPLWLLWTATVACLVASTALALHRRRDRAVDPVTGRTVPGADAALGGFLPWLAPALFVVVVVFRLLAHH